MCEIVEAGLEALDQYGYYEHGLRRKKMVGELLSMFINRNLEYNYSNIGALFNRSLLRSHASPNKVVDDDATSLEESASDWLELEKWDD